MSGTRLRAARNADIPALQRLVGAASVPSPDWETVVWALGAAVATRDDRIVGVLVLWPHPDHVLVETLAVAPEEQGRGVGSALLDRAELTAIEAGSATVRLAAGAATTEALGFAARRGYREVDGRRPLVLERRFA